MNEFNIQSICAREIIDCRGLPTIEVDVILDNGLRGRAAVPAGLSKGVHEAKEIRDGGSRYLGLGVRKAIDNVHREIAPKLKGMLVTRQMELDYAMIELDGTPDKSRLGANAIVGVSLAAARAAAEACNLPLYRYLNAHAHVIPVPMVNLINGGKHASNNLDFQEFIIMPLGADSIAEALQMSTEINIKLRELLIKKYGKLAVNVGDEGGYAPPMKEVREAIDPILESVEKAGYQDKMAYGLDVAASHLYDSDTKTYTVEGKKLTREQFIDFYKKLIKDYPIVSIEDPLQEDDFEGFAILTRELDIQIVGDDLFVTSPERIRRGVEMNAGNALLWKVNQIGTLSEAISAAEIAVSNGYGVVVSERSGETEDAIMSDLVVGLNAGQIKTGAPVRGERTSKYNQLLRIEEEMGSMAKYAGRNYRNPS